MCMFNEEFSAQFKMEPPYEPRKHHGVGVCGGREGITHEHGAIQIGIDRHGERVRIDPKRVLKPAARVRVEGQAERGAVWQIERGGDGHWRRFVPTADKRAESACGTACDGPLRTGAAGLATLSIGSKPQSAPDPASGFPGPRAEC